MTPIKAWIACLCLAIPAIALASNTPGSYTHYAFDPAVKGMQAVDFGITVQTDPGYRANVFWSNQFSLVGGQGGYTGMQSNGGDKRMFLFSLWDATEAKPGSAGSYCLSFGGEGVGRSCRMAHAWKAGHRYRFHLAFEGDRWLGVTVTDTTTGQSFKLGSIRAKVDEISPKGMVDWTEYFEWNSPLADCNTQPYASAQFDLPSGDDGHAMAHVANTEASKSCTSYTAIDRTAAGSVQRNGIGNSLRGAVTNGSGQCAAVAKNAKTAVARSCRSDDGQAWVYAIDHTLRLQNNTCLGVASDQSANVTSSACTGGPSQQWEAAAGQLKSRANGRCLTSSTDGAPLTVQACKGGSAQSWQLPPTPR
ncbi:DUF3472 domain-containing protein [Dyella mobilis]|uniref:Ricin-type beta-trefoil lectin domain protein n=1 Tax=Dyella mobilis TaxID=1849582 RepID=A0ABS2KHR5_9GAMM|nr:DUF3472 domain-containing protein [Dyella mobilis]MBM7130704.1 ricin-type beta-trefoil lectin domain protein [Dyella mobilis]GLQ97327.1 hypothetical protein GCM10007863_17470 [Dyella mobilis]